ncbi:MAG: DUF58 domain-containing protein [Patescibacteria group bacterium]
MIYDEVVAAMRRIERGFPIKTLSRNRQLGENQSLAQGRGIDFYQYREYDPGTDSVEQIAWGVQAGFGDEVYVREARPTREFPLLILADTSSSLRFGPELFPPKLRLLLEVAGTLGLTAAYQRDRVGLLAFADKVLIEERPRGGESNVYYLILQLCKFFEKFADAEKPRKTDLWQAVDYVRRNFPEPCLVAVLSDFVGCEAIADSPLLRSPHEFIFFILEDEEEFSSLPQSGILHMSDMETGKRTDISLGKLRKLEAHLKEKQDDFRKRLQKNGVDSLVLNYGGHFEALAKFSEERRWQA